MAPASSNPTVPRSQFVAVQGQPETTSAGAVLVTAYALLWVLAFAFLVSTWRRLARLNTRLDSLEATLADREQDGPAP